MYINKGSSIPPLCNCPRLCRRSWLIRLVYEEMLVDGIPPDWTTFEEAMYQLMRARRVGDCLYFFKEMQRWGRQPNVRSLW